MDIRLATGPFLRKPSITHNYKYQDFFFLVRDTVRFLQRHKNEVVVMRLKEGKKDTNYYGIKFSWRVNWRKVDRVLSRYPSYVYSSKQNPLSKRVSDLRGKIIICQEASTRKSTYYRVLCQGSWSRTNTNNPVQLKTKMTHWLNRLPSHSTSKFYFLEAICTPKGSDITNAINPFNCKRSGNRRLYEPKSLEDLAKECNYQVYQWLRGKSVKKINAMMIDFANPQILNLIIAKN